MNTLRRWHRRLGLAAAAMLALLALSGMLLNHADALGLPGLRLHTPWLARLYGAAPAAPRSAWAVQGRWISDWDGQLALDAAPLALQVPGGLAGVLALEGGWLLATPHQATLVTPQGQPVDTLGYPPGQTVRAAARDAKGNVWLETTSGAWLHGDAALTVLHPAPAAPPALARAMPGTLPPALAHLLAQRGTGPGVSAERVLLDLHGGRFLGPAGPWLMDAAGLALLVLACSGVWMSARHRRK